VLHSEFLAVRSLDEYLGDQKERVASRIHTAVDDLQAVELERRRIDSKGVLAMKD